MITSATVYDSEGDSVINTMEKQYTCRKEVKLWLTRVKSVKIFSH